MEPRFGTELDEKPFEAFYKPNKQTAFNRKETTVPSFSLGKHYSL